MLGGPRNSGDLHLANEKDKMFRNSAISIKQHDIIENKVLDDTCLATKKKVFPIYATHADGTYITYVVK